MPFHHLSITFLALLVLNFSPLLGVFLLGWNVETILLLYWMENVIIGYYNVLKMVAAKRTLRWVVWEKLITIPFFCIHFSGYCLIQLGFFVVELDLSGITFGFVHSGHRPEFLNYPFQLVLSFFEVWKILPKGIEWIIIGLFISHGVDFIQEFLWREDRLQQTQQQLMLQPYGRTFLLFFVIIGAIPAMILLDSPHPLLFMLLLCKFVIDVAFYLRGRTTSGQSKTDTAIPDNS